jgi:hypothetical protein
MTMKTIATKWTVIGILLGGCFLLVTNEAMAYVGRPLTPVSVAGVARRTTRRTVAATNAAKPDTVVVKQTTVVVAAPPVGTVVTSLPAGSQSAGDDFVCNGVYYRPTIQGSKLVYVVVAH